MRVLVAGGQIYDLEAEAVLQLAGRLSTRHGIQLTSDPRGAWDLGWVSFERFDEFDGSRPLIIDAPYDEIDLRPAVCRALRSPHVQFVTRPALFRPRSLYAAAVVQGSLFRRWIQESQAAAAGTGTTVEYERQPPLSLAELDRLVINFSYPALPRLESLIKTNVDVSQPRSINVSFIGTTEYPQPLVAWHRRTCANAVRNLTGCRAVSESCRAYDAEAYFRHLLQTKIVVSPWGWSERCHRDGEALLAGCVIVKPESSHIESWPDIYRAGEMYVRCRPDFADLQHVVDGILNNWWDWEERRAGNRRWLLEEVQPWRLAARMARIFAAGLYGGYV